MQQILLGSAATLAVAAIVGVVTLAFKNPRAYAKLSKVLIALLAACAVAYLGYMVGFQDGGKFAASEVTAGKPAESINTTVSIWPLTAMSFVFTALITLQWFPEYLGIDGPDKQSEK